MYSPWVPDSARTWKQRQALIRNRLLSSHADIICIQEADGDTFEQDFDFMKQAGYGHVLHKKFRFRCATFYKQDRLELIKEAHKDRALVTALRFRSSTDDNGREYHQKNTHDDESIDLVHTINCHLSGGAAPERRIRQVDEVLDQLRKWKNAAANTLAKQQKANRPSPKNIAAAEDAVRSLENAGVELCGDFNSDGNTGVRKLLVEGAVDPSWREQQYPATKLTSKRREQPYSFVDAAELAYASNVCDGDYGEHHGAHGSRPATYVVPNLASLLLSPVNIDGKERHDRTEFGHQVAKGLAANLSLQEFCDTEIEDAFERVDLDRNGIIDEDEVKKLLDSVYIALYGKEMGDRIEREKEKFFGNFSDDENMIVNGGLTLDQFKERLLALRQELEGGREGSELVQINTEADAARMIGRFSPILRQALNKIFEHYSSNG